VAVPFFAQDAYQCGPAALATVLVHDGVQITPEQLTAQVYLPERQGSLQAELISATRRNGRVPYRLPPTLMPILEELRGGRPVLVLQNLGFGRWPVWHYAVLVGYDAQAETFLLRSGDERRRKTSARAFLASWDRGGRWALVVAPPTAAPASANAQSWLQAVAPFESTGELETAAAGYREAVRRWPQDADAWTALGNVRYRQSQLADAETAYRRALDLSTAQWTARNNLVLTLVARGCADAAREWIEQAGVPPDTMTSAWSRTLERWAAARDTQCSG